MFLSASHVDTNKDVSGNTLFLSVSHVQTNKNIFGNTRVSKCITRRYKWGWGGGEGGTRCRPAMVEVKTLPSGMLMWQRSDRVRSTLW